jgi:hypothetical protein
MNTTCCSTCGLEECLADKMLFKVLFKILFRALFKLAFGRVVHNALDRDAHDRDKRRVCHGRMPFVQLYQTMA